jgi:hypothetical protein
MEFAVTKNLLNLGPKLDEDEKVILTTLYLSPTYDKTDGILNGKWQGGAVGDHPYHQFDPAALLMSLEEALKRSAFWLDIGATYPGEESLLKKLRKFHEQGSGSSSPAKTKEG